MPDYDLIFDYEVVTASPQYCIELLDLTSEKPHTLSSHRRFLIVLRVSNEGEPNDGEIMAQEFANSLSDAAFIISRRMKEAGL